MIEALLLSILATLALAAVLGFQGNGLALNLNSGTSSSIRFGINAGSEPLQQSTPFFKTIVPVPGGNATLTSDSAYTISAKVESIRGYDDSISGLVPYDLLLTWGDMAHDDVDSKLTWEQSDRRGEVSGSLDDVDLSSGYIISHISNNHVIPATDAIASALGNVKSGDLVRIEGRLVDVREILYDGRIITVNTSKTRADQGDGACEIIYIEHLRVNGRNY